MRKSILGRGRGRIINGKLRGAHTSFLAVFISLIFFAGSAAAQERQTIEWYQIFPGQDRNDFFENLLTLYQTTLSGYEHSEVDAIPRRFLEDAKSKPHACTSTLLWAKSREKVLVYSKPYLAPLSQGVLISKAKAKAKRFTPYVDDHGRYDIDAILSAGLQIGMVPGRTYGKEIDAIVARHADSPVLVPLHYNPKNVLAILLKRDSLDGLFAFPGEYGSAVEELKAENDLVFLQPQQKQQENIYVTCARSEFGRGVISSIDALLTDPAFMKRIEALYLNWLGPAERETYKKLQKGR